MPAGTLAIVLAILAGISIATQQIFNGGLRSAVDSVWWAGLVSYLGGTVFMMAALLMTGASLPSSTLFELPLRSNGPVEFSAA